MENNNWGAPQQQGAQWPGAAGFQPALGPYAAYGAYPPMAPRAYPMLMAAPAQQGMLAAAPAQQLAPPPPPLPRAAPKDISTWLDEVKPGYGEKYASIFEDLGVDDEDDVQNLRDDLARDLRAALENAGAKRGHLNNIESAVIAKRANAAPRHLALLPPPPPLAAPPRALPALLPPPPPAGPRPSALLTAWLDEVQCQGPVRERVLAIANDVPELFATSVEDLERECSASTLKPLSWSRFRKAFVKEKAARAAAAAPATPANNAAPATPANVAPVTPVAAAPSPAAPATPAAAPAPAPADEEELPDAPPPEASDDEGAPMDTTDEAPRFQIGDTVEVAARTFPGINKSGGPGTVTKVNDERNEDGGPMRDGSSSRTTGFTYAVKYTMGGSEKRVDAQWITKSTDEDADADAFAVGDRIEARWGKGTTWYPGAVTKVRPPKTRGRSSTFDVLYDDGEAEESVQPEDMRPPRSSSLRPSPKRVKTPAAAKKRPVTTTEDRVPRDTRKRWPAKVANIVDDLVVDGADLPRVLDLFRDRCLIRGEVPLDRTLKGLLRALAKAADPRAADLLRACLSLSVEEDLDSASLDEDALLERLENDLGFDAAEKRDALLDRLAHSDTAAAEALGAAPNAAGAGRRTAALARGAGVAAPKGDGPLDVLVRGILST